MQIRASDEFCDVQINGAVMIFPNDYVLRSDDIVFVMCASLQTLAEISKLKVFHYEDKVRRGSF